MEAMRETGKWHRKKEASIPHLLLQLQGLIFLHLLLIRLLLLLQHLQLCLVLLSQRSEVKGQSTQFKVQLARPLTLRWVCSCSSSVILSS